jgi:hypothetical protein
VSEIHTSNGRIPLTKDPKENGYKPWFRAGDAPRFRWGKKLIASSARSAATPHRHSERSEESLCAFRRIPNLAAAGRRGGGRPQRVFRSGPWGICLGGTATLGCASSPHLSSRGA